MPTRSAALTTASVHPSGPTDGTATGNAPGTPAPARSRWPSRSSEWLLEPRRRAERAFVQVVAECYVRGVSTRRVEGLVRQLGIERISKSRVSEMATELDAAVEAFRTRPLDGGSYTYVWIDALVQKVREIGRASCRERV